VVKIRSFRKRDHRGVLRVLKKVIKEHGLYRHHLPGLKGLEDIPKTYFLPKGRFLVAVSGGKVVGCEGLIPRKNGWAELNRMYLDRALRGRGLGRRIFQDLLGHARKKRFKRVYLDSSTRFERAIRLCADAGINGSILKTENRCNVLMKMRL